MSWNHLMALSKSSDTNLSDSWTTYLACSCMMAPSSVQSDETKVLQIAENILENYHYNFVAKYLFICSDFDLESDLNTEICDMAFEHLLDVTQNADEETYRQVVETAVKLYHKYGLKTEEVEGLYDKYDFVIFSIS